MVVEDNRIRQRLSFFYEALLKFVTRFGDGARHLVVIHCTDEPFIRVFKRQGSGGRRVTSALSLGIVCFYALKSENHQTKIEPWWRKITDG